MEFQYVVALKSAIVSVVVLEEYLRKLHSVPFYGHHINFGLSQLGQFFLVLLSFNSLYIFTTYNFVYFFGAGDETHSLEHAKEALCH